MYNVATVLSSLEVTQSDLTLLNGLIVKLQKESLEREGKSSKLKSSAARYLIAGAKALLEASEYESVLDNKPRPAG
jgi:hypothetical protein